MSKLQENLSNGLKVHLIYVVSSKSKLGEDTEKDISKLCEEKTSCVVTWCNSASHHTLIIPSFPAQMDPSAIQIIHDCIHEKLYNSCLE
jgi:hypothetical protein